MRTITFILITLAVVSCDSKREGNQKDFAKEVTFYFQIENQGTTAFSNTLKNQLEREFPTKKYAITNSSGNVWPFYEEIPMDQHVYKDSLMTPHTFIHVMKKEEGQPKKEGDRMMKIIIFPNGNPDPAYSMAIFEWKNQDWSFEAQTGLEPIDSSLFSTDNQLISIFKKSILRYSFK